MHAKSVCVWIVLVCIPMFIMADEPGLPYGPTVVSVVLEHIPSEIMERDGEIWLEVEYLLSPEGEGIFLEPAERLWFAGESAVVILGAAGKGVPHEMLDRGVGWVRLRHEDELLFEKALPIYPRRDQFRLGGEADHLTVALSRRLPGVNASHLSQVAHFLAGNLTDLEVQGTSYTVVGYGPVISTMGEWVGQPIHDVQIGRFFLSSSGVVVSTDGSERVLSWNESSAQLQLSNLSSDWLDFWWQSQKGSTTAGNSGAIAATTLHQPIIAGTNTNDYGFEVHFGQADGQAGWCSVWLQYANGYLVGHYIKY